MQSGKQAVNRFSVTAFTGIFLRVQRTRDIQRQLQPSLPAPKWQGANSRAPVSAPNAFRGFTETPCKFIHFEIPSHRLRQISQRPPAYSWLAGGAGFRSSIDAL